MPLVVSHWRQCHSTKHTCLENIYTYIARTGVNLLFNKVGRRDMHTSHAFRVLRRQCCRCCHGIGAMSSNDFLVSLEATVAN